MNDDNSTTLRLAALAMVLLVGCEHPANMCALDQSQVPTGVAAAVAFVDVNVIPMDSERVLAGQTVLVSDGRIQDIGLSSDVTVPPDAVVVDGTGKFLIPGLSDMHAHLFGNENDLLLYLANGVTTLRDLGDGPTVQLKWRDEIDVGERTGPTLLQWSPMFETMSWLDENISDLESPGGKVNASNVKGMEGLVAAAAAKGYDGIKGHVVFSTDIYQAILNAAAEHNMRFDAHAPIDLIFCSDWAACWDEFRSLGADAVPHMEELVKIVDWSPEAIQQAARDVADDGMWVTSTMALMRSLAAQVSDYEGELARVPEAIYVNPNVYRARWDPRNFSLNNYPNDMSGYLEANEEMLVALNDAGANLMSGTDAPLPFLVPGFSLHDELEYMVDLGLSSYDALRTSTYNPAEYMGRLEEAGTIEPGKHADMVLLDANPLVDIADTRSISGVMAHGKWFSRDDLDELLKLVLKANHECWSTAVGYSL
jgi:imidazolonepropionase-like amidohydrolase